jgi:hypothetical protein
MVTTAVPGGRTYRRARALVAPVAMWAVWRVAHLAFVMAAGGRPERWWDDGYYRLILRQGYEHYAPYGDWQQTNFFPLLPWITRAVQTVVMSEPVAMHLVVTAAQLAAVLMLYVVGTAYFDRTVALGAVGLLLLCPASVFLWMFFSEGLFIALSIGAMLAAERGRPVLAGLLGAGVAATRTIGVLIVLPLAIALLRQGRRDRRLVMALLPVGGLLAVMGAQWLQAGDPLAFMHVSEAWGRHTTLPTSTLFVRLDFALETGIGVATVLDLAAVTIAVLLALRARRIGLPWSIQAFAWIAILAPLASGLAFSWLRYMSAAWPLYLVAADWLRRRPVPARVVVAVVLAGFSVNRIFIWSSGQFIG